MIKNVQHKKFSFTWTITFIEEAIFLNSFLSFSLLKTHLRISKPNRICTELVTRPMAVLL
ncbi:hypothetical protein Anas_12644 [Armadillidium nasatum]|uniref:Uncharacterized protein n=1 Tax=Armadillidium nasatum TaxID=96803 RepID=A0A5N5T9U7_9CRUS|nr:hypothetical protein Anas_12644 [Armadillidium nasatum]